MSQINPILQELQDVTEVGWTRIKKGKFWPAARKAINEGDNGIFVKLMHQVYHYARHNALNQTLATFGTDSRRGELIRFSMQHGLEELGHELMIVNDLKKLGAIQSEDELQSVPVVPANRAFICFLYYVSQHEDITARLGYSYWAESSYHQFADILAAFKERFGVGNSELSFFTAHGEIDKVHFARLTEMLTKYVVTDTQRQKCREVAETTLYLTGCMLEQLAENYY